jgi:hypothetical protein
MQGMKVYATIHGNVPTMNEAETETRATALHIGAVAAVERHRQTDLGAGV